MNTVIKLWWDATPFNHFAFTWHHPPCKTNTISATRLSKAIFIFTPVMATSVTQKPYDT